MSNDSDNDDKANSGNSFKESLANLMTPGDGFSYRDGVLTADKAESEYGDFAGGKNGVEVSDGTSNTFSVSRDVTKGYNRGLIGSMVAGALTGGLPGLTTGIVGNATRDAVKDAVS